MAAMKKVSKELNVKKLAEFKKLVTKQAKAVYLKAMGFTAQESAFNLKTSVASVQSMICKSKSKVEKPAKVKAEKINLDKFTTKQDKAVYLKSIGWTSDSIATLLITSIASIHSMISKSKSKAIVKAKIETDKRRVEEKSKARSAKPKKERKAKKAKEPTSEEAAAIELKRRADLKKNDKIFNNSYFQADKLKGDDYVFDKSIKIDPAYHGSSVLANLAPEKAMVYNNMRRLMIKALDNHPEMKEMFSEDKKLNKSMLNNAFAILYESVASNRSENIFVNVIYLFDFLSNISGVKYPNLFEMLEYKYKELLIQELDEEFNILGDYVNLRKMF